jgi:hypothetical protein
MFAALPQPGVPNTSQSSSSGSASSLLMNDLFWVVAVGAAVFAVLLVGVWLHHRWQKRPVPRAGARRRRSERVRSGRQNPALAELGGLPPGRADSSSQGKLDADQ